LAGSACCCGRGRGRPSICRPAPVQLRFNVVSAMGSGPFAGSRKCHAAGRQVWRSLANRSGNLGASSRFFARSLRFGKLDVARQALERVAPSDRDSAAFHVVAGWLAHAQGNLAEQEEQFAAAVRKEPQNDLYQFNLAALQIHSSDATKSAQARATLERLSKVAPHRAGALRALLNDAVARNHFADAANFAQQLQMSPEVMF